MSRIRLVTSLLLCLLPVAFTMAQTAPAASNVITVSVLVVEAAGRAVTGLEIKDFRILENDVEQPLVSMKVNSLVGDYTLVYTPTNTATDGTWRKVRVEIVGVLGPGLTVRHASGYSAHRQ